MGDLQKIQKQFTAVAAILSVTALALLMYLFWPGSGRRAQDEERASLEHQRIELTNEVNLQKSSNPEKTRSDLKVLYTDLPGRYSQISQRMEKLFQETGVSPSASIKYSIEQPDKTDLPDVQRIKIETTVTSDYAKVARFINAVEQDPLLFVIEKISLSGQPEGNAVSLQITFETYLKGAA